MIRAGGARPSLTRCSAVRISLATGQDVARPEEGIAPVGFNLLAFAEAVQVFGRRIGHFQVAKTSDPMKRQEIRIVKSMGATQAVVVSRARGDEQIVAFKLPVNVLECMVL